MPPGRTKVALGVYRDAHGFEAIITRHGQTHRKRFAPDTPVRLMRRWRDEIAGASRLAPRPVRRGTLAADVDAYLAQVAHLANWIGVRAELRAWTARLGTRPRWSLEPGDIRHARVDWLADGLSSKTINHRVHTLSRLYRVLDGKRAPNPCVDVEDLDVAETIPVLVEAATITAVLARLEAQEASGRLRDAKTRARLMVLASTGVRPSELMRAQPSDVDLERRVWRTRDGKGGYRPYGLELSDDMRAAWTRYREADAWGPFNTGSMARVLRTAGWPAGVRPYNLRHTVGLELAERGADLADISAFLGHSRPLTTRSHYVPVSQTRMAQTTNRLQGRFGWLRDPATSASGGSPDGTSGTANAPSAASRSSDGARLVEPAVDSAGTTAASPDGQTRGPCERPCAPPSSADGPTSSPARAPAGSHLSPRRDS